MLYYWNPRHPASQGKYGSFYDTQTQTVTELQEEQGFPVKLRTTSAASGFSILNDSKIKAQYPGVYDFQFSFQFNYIGGGGSGTHVEIWLVINGNQVADTNTRLTISSNNPYTVAAWDFIVPVEAGDEVQIYWATDNYKIEMTATTSTMGGPNIPSSIVTVIPVA